MVTAGLLSRARAGDGEAFRELTGPHRCVRLIAGLGGGTVKGYPEGAGSVPAGFLVQRGLVDLADFPNWLGAAAGVK